jgi:iron uptake system EfeUOB component EfeO/EfeM
MRRVALLLASGLLAGCGGSEHAANPPAPQLAQRIPGAGNVPTARPADFRAPIARYRRHVRSELGAMLGDLRRLRTALAAGDLGAARTAWLAADARYETIGAAYGAFGDLDAAINGRADGLPGGIRSRAFTGLHRIELALWRRRSTRDAAAPAARLARDVARLRARVNRIEIDPFEYALRSHEVLEDTLHLQLSGQASPWSGAALTALDGNLRGTRVVLASVRGMVRRRDPAVLQRAERSLHTLTSAVDAVRRRDGRLPRWDTLAQPDRIRIAGLTAAATEQLAYVPELIDPRPPRTQPAALGVHR